jgi:hypothetical protein
MEFHFDTATPTKKIVRFQTEPHDTVEWSPPLWQRSPVPRGDMQESTKTSPLYAELIEDYKRDRLAAGNRTPNTQDDNLVFRLCIDIIGDLRIDEIGDDQALTYVETLKRLPPNMNKMPAYTGKTIDEIIAHNRHRWQHGRSINPLSQSAEERRSPIATAAPAMHRRWIADGR